MSDVANDQLPDLVDVHLVAVPVQLWARAQEWGDELTREFTLIAAGLREKGSHTEVPVRLIELIDALTARYGSLNVAQEAQLAAAAEAGEQAIDELVFRVPEHAGEATVELQAMLDEADAYCQSGDHLLTLASPPELVRFRNWYLEEFPRQLTGQPPIPWPEYRR